MEFLENEIYHVYNRGNNRENIFYKPANYLFFLSKVQKQICPICDILGWNLMPNHFNFLLRADKRTIQTKKIAGESRNVLSEGIRNLLSSYTQAINSQNNRTGSLFQQNTKAISIPYRDGRQIRTCLNYIHQKPVKAELVTKMEDWEFSSFKDYCGLREPVITNKEIVSELFGIDIETFYRDSYKIVEEIDARIFH